ncbi:MAG: hypothetical protein LBH69_03990 [Methanomassiliicoccaceae archaeon]|jgi:hypothetical protein|nr:hypothetical protein [Methanomassiliicoccaceae archaeon]
MKIHTVLIILLVAALPLAAAVIGESASGAGKIPGLAGNGTGADPYLISSAADLRTMSASYQNHSGATYRQTADIVFSDTAFPGDKAYVLTSVSGGKVKGTITVNAKTVSTATSVKLYLNGNPVAVKIQGKLVEFEVDTGTLKDSNSLAATGTIEGNSFGIAVNFSKAAAADMSVSAPIRGNFTPIGTNDVPFVGTYDGNGRSITGIKVVSTGPDDACTGLFGKTGSGTIYDVTILSKNDNASYFLTNAVSKNSYQYVTSPPQTLASYTGSIVGCAAPGTSVIACRNEATVLSETELAKYYLFTGMSGFLNITRNFNFEAASYTGGIAGYGTGYMYRCENTGNVISSLNSSFTYNVSNDPFDASNKYKCTFNISACNYAGGLLGYTETADVSSSGNTGLVSALSSYFVKIDHTQYLDNITATLNETFVTSSGGIVGSAQKGIISDVYNYGAVAADCDFTHRTLKTIAEKDVQSFTFDLSAGGIAGRLGNIEIKRAYNRASVTAGGTVTATLNSIQNAGGVRYAGQIVGMAKSDPVTLTACYYTDISAGLPVTGNRSHTATKIPASEKLSSATFPAWDFSKTWAISDNGTVTVSVRNPLTIIDRSGTNEGTVRYSIDSQHTFDAGGTLSGYVDRKGFAVTLKEDYKSSVISLYITSGNDKIFLTKDGSGRYQVPQSYLVFGGPVTVNIDGLVADPVRNMKIEDRSNTNDSAIKYSIDRTHTFASGILSSQIDKRGFALTLKKDYEGSDIQLYVMDAGKRTVLAKEGGRYIVPLQHIIAATTVTVYIEGLVADPVREMKIIDTSEFYDPAGKYLIERQHSFDGEGTLTAQVDKWGFLVALKKDYLSSEI